MANKGFPVARSAALGLLVVGLGTWAGMGARGGLARARGRAALAAVDAREPRALRIVRASERVRLEQGPLPIERAMDEMATRGRLAVDAGLLPLRSTDLAPLQGWAFHSNDVPPWMLAEDGGAPDASE